MKTISTLLLAGMLLAFPSVGQQTSAQPVLSGYQAPSNNSSSSSIWKKVNEDKITVLGTRYITPSDYRTMELDLTAMHAILDAAPMENTTAAQNKKTTFDLPLPDGTMQSFTIEESPVMEAGLQSMFPEIRTYRGIATDKSGAFARFDFTPQGFHAMILYPGKSTVFIDPYSFGGGDITNYIVYERNDFQSSVQKMMDCGFTGATTTTSGLSQTGKVAFSSCELRTYRLALAATGEYTTFHGGTVALAQAAQVTTMNRVNGVYERDMAIHMNIVAGNNALIFTNSGGDPYTNNNGGAMLGQNQTEVDNTIGSANYDIGHVFSTGGGGIAGLGVVCANGAKAQGVTGSGAPIGDPFDIDYVCHEIGHQFGANHTQNNNCQRNAATAMEPGSASTIMGYAGICAPNVQNNSDDHFHGVSLAEIGAEISGHTCPATTVMANGAPTISGTNAAGITVPANTPFALTATATDPDGNTLTYNWEQMDNDISTQPPAANATGGPNFRSFSSSTDPTRYFPNLPDLTNGTVSQWEVLPSVSRTMDFRCVVRDNAPGGGCHDHTDITINIDGNSGPFVVQYPSATGIVWAGLTAETVTWDVANTDQAPVSCANVDILLSTDGGVTYPTVLASNVPNDGSQAITVPNTATTTARIMVICANGTFFDISDNNFEITAATFDYTLTTSDDTESVCSPSNAVYTIDIGQVGGYTDPVTLSTSGVPAGAIATFGTNPVTPAGTSTLTISNTGAATPGSYTITVTANSTSGTKTLDLFLNISNGSPTAVTLTTPANAATGITAPTTMNWTASAEPGATYEIEIATDAAFTAIVEQSTGLATNSYTSGALASSTIHYWRVRVVTGCGTSAWSTVFSFETSTCSIYTATDTPITISNSGTPTITSTITVATVGAIQDVNITSLTGTHTWINDLTVTLTSPTGTVVSLWDQVCNNEDDFDLAFDDGAAPGALPCPPVGGGTYQPASVLSALNGEDANGVWTLTITDNVNQDGGILTGWSLEICVAPPAAEDAGVTSIINPTGQICDNPFTPEVEITNFGTSNLTSATINYQIDNGPVQTQNWTGNLAQGATENVVLAPITSPTVGAPITFTAYTTLPNGVIDPNTINDTSAVTITILASGTFPYAQDFETATMPADLTIFNADADALQWVHSNTISAYGVGSGSASIDNYNNDVQGTLDWIQLPILDLTSSTNTIVTFDVAYAPYDAAHTDTLIVGVNDNCGTNYTTNYQKGGLTLATTGGYATNAFTPTTTQWRNDTVDLSAYDGQSNVRIAFINKNGYGNFLWLDNINVITNVQTAQGTDTQTACDSYTWIDGITYTTSNNTATHLLVGGASNGSDSLVTLDLTINYSNTGTDVISACDSYTWIDGMTYTASNSTATHTLTNAAGCDSVVTLNLTINSSSFGTDVITACDSYMWIDGVTYTASNNSAMHTLTNAAGCDSVVSLDLSINYSSSGTDVITTCDSYTWINGVTYTASNSSATHTLTNAAGCDSVVSLDLTINNSTTGIDVISACNSYVWIDGVTYTASNNSATHTLTNAAGCDSVVSLDLTINTATSGNDIITACISYTWINGITYTTSNNSATHTLTNAAGCDSVVSLDLTITTFATGTDVISACDTYMWIDGVTYTASNNSATHTIVGGSVNGCDSIVSLDLTINFSSTATDVISACDSYTWINGVTYTTSNSSATHTLTNAAGCDSVISLDLTINNSSTGMDFVTACDSYTWIDGVTYTASNNTATHTLTNTSGCDSVVSLDLTINNSTTGIDAITTCISFTWIDGVTYTASNNTATHTLTNAAGCDSVVSLDLTITTFSTGTDVITACDSYTWSDGVTYTASNNTATQTIVGGSVNGCDSIVTLNLTINTATSGTDVITACDSYLWIDGVMYTASNNTATHTLTNAAGCDSIVTLELTIETIDAGITQTAYNTLEANFAGGGYQWIDCNDNSSIAGATNQTYTATANGSYAVIVSSGNCSDTSECMNISTIGIDEIAETSFDVYPNPTDNILTVNLKDAADRDYELYDATGRIIMYGNLVSGENQLSVVHLARGTYTLKISGDSGVKSIIKL